MRSQCALYVDAGYLLAASAHARHRHFTAQRRRRRQRALITSLIAQAEVDSGMPLLRVSWYDSGNRAGGLPTSSSNRSG